MHIPWSSIPWIGWGEWGFLQSGRGLVYCIAIRHALVHGGTNKVQLFAYQMTKSHRALSGLKM